MTHVPYPSIEQFRQVVAEHGCTIYRIEGHVYALVCPNSAPTDVLTQAGKTATQALTR